jgi:hypothetical protein
LLPRQFSLLTRPKQRWQGHVYSTYIHVHIQRAELTSSVCSATRARRMGALHRRVATAASSMSRACKRWVAAADAEGALMAADTRALAAREGSSSAGARSRSSKPCHVV